MLPTMKTIRTALAALALSLAAASAGAQLSIAGETFPATMTVAESPLVLNGVGVRAVLWFKGYAAGLYLASPARSAPAVLELAGPKRLQMRMMQEVDAQEFVKATDAGIEKNTTPEQRAALAERQATFNRQVQAVGRVRKGDVVDLDFVPARGLVFSLNGHVRGDAIHGADFYAAVLRIFIGEHPVDRPLKAGLLGAAP